MQKSFFLFLIISIFTLAHSQAADMRGRLGIGASNQLANNIPAVSFKVQRNRSFALGGLLGFRSNEEATLYGVGVKFYRIIFDEPQLNFYLAGLFATENFLNQEREVQSGYQVDGTLGTEFHFSGLESIGFSFEMGISARNTDPVGGASIETLGDQFLKAAFHFYL